MHAKVTVADDTVFLGSFNLSRSGEENAENVLEIADAALADRLAAFVDELRARYSGAWVSSAASSRQGPPEPSSHGITPTISVAPRGGIAPRLATFSSP